ncbi:DUF4412 domain-containing protein [Daejeonella sp. JGW-45]|uniref:DUF4412 domain-containing protein n=1 Tax=Daejeonella sp. JGW-45 TaxID=3034148 RepID=UPI0023ED986D|nr:DUF4412 domain-containing protein [Daejeonella sp. JGW-45]
MKKIILLLLLGIGTISATPDAATFTGKIQYRYSFTDLQGNDITDRAAPLLGREQHYFVSDSNYKSYDETNTITQLYNSRSNTYFGFWKDKTASRIDALTRTSQQYKVTRLNKKEKILGYDCVAIQVETDNTSTIYYYSPLLRIDYKAYAKHNFGEWNNYLETTRGALSLKYIITNPQKGYVWTVLAEKITAMKLNARAFEFPQGYELRN